MSLLSFLLPTLVVNYNIFGIHSIISYAPTSAARSFVLMNLLKEVVRPMYPATNDIFLTFILPEVAIRLFLLLARCNGTCSCLMVHGRPLTYANFVINEMIF